MEQSMIAAITTKHENTQPVAVKCIKQSGKDDNAKSRGRSCSKIVGKTT